MTNTKSQIAKANLNFITILFFVITWQFFQNEFWTSLGLAFTVYVTYEFIDSLGKTIELPKILVLTSAYQWIVGPWIDYITPEKNPLYYMYVPETQYMAFIVPGIISLYIGISIFSTPVNLEELGNMARKFSLNFPQFPYLLIFVGFGITLIEPYVPSSIYFVYFLIKSFQYIGLIYLIFSKEQHKWVIVTIVMLTALSFSISQGIFGDVLLWMVLLFTFLVHQFKISLFKTLIFVAIGVFFMITIQSIKSKIRSQEFVTYKGNLIIRFFEISIDEWQNGAIFLPEKNNDLNVRLNQGWIISKVMDYVPVNEPFARGETILTGIKASILPRILFPDKAEAGGRKNFTRFTGLTLNENTSMGISLAGEAWANFGTVGGAIFLFLWGIFVGWTWKKLQDISTSFATIIIWSPLIFQEVVKAETDFVSVINFLVKSFIVVIVMIWVLKKQFKIAI